MACGRHRGGGAGAGVGPDGERGGGRGRQGQSHGGGAGGGGAGGRGGRRGERLRGSSRELLFWEHRLRQQAARQELRRPRGIRGAHMKGILLQPTEGFVIFFFFRIFFFLNKPEVRLLCFSVLRSGRPHRDPPPPPHPGSQPRVAGVHAAPALRGQSQGGVSRAAPGCTGRGWGGRWHTRQVAGDRIRSLLTCSRQRGAAGRTRPRLCRARALAGPSVKTLPALLRAAGSPERVPSHTAAFGPFPSVPVSLEAGSPGL